ncbi:ABC transporter permease [Streptomyces sp. R-74717]|uniref:ABC transporter permease n=1 Tax=Streptomyces TaxID=1883 RepID=UPI0037A63D56
MTSPTHTLWLGTQRGLLELAHLARTKRELWSQLVGNLVVLLVLASTIGDGQVSGAPVPSSHLYVAGFISMGVFQTCLISLPQILATEREDGTLLRMRAVPGGVSAYLVSKAVVVTSIAMANAVVLLVGGVLGAGAPWPKGFGGWITLAWVLVLGLISVAPLGAAVGAVLPNAREAIALVTLPMLGLLVVSGIFFPVTALPTALQWTGELFPLKWIAQGVRSALLPDALLPTETGHSWQHLQILVVLSAWTVAGALLAPRLLRRMARRESGSRLASRREMAQQRVGP